MPVGDSFTSLVCAIQISQCQLLGDVSRILRRFLSARRRSSFDTIHFSAVSGGRWQAPQTVGDRRSSRCRGSTPTRHAAKDLDAITRMSHRRQIPQLVVAGNSIGRDGNIGIATTAPFMRRCRTKFISTKATTGWTCSFLRRRGCLSNLRFLLVIVNASHKRVRGICGR